MEYIGRALNIRYTRYIPGTQVGISTTCVPRYVYTWYLVGPSLHTWYLIGVYSYNNHAVYRNLIMVLVHIIGSSKLLNSDCESRQSQLKASTVLCELS